MLLSAALLARPCSRSPARAAPLAQPPPARPRRSLSLNLSIYMYLSLSLCLCKYTCACVQVYACICMYMHICVAAAAPPAPSNVRFWVLRRFAPSLPLWCGRGGGGGEANNCARAELRYYSSHMVTRGAKAFGHQHVCSSTTFDLN